MWNAPEAFSGESVHRRYVVHVLWYRPPNAMHLKVEKLSVSVWSAVAMADVEIRR